LSGIEFALDWATYEAEMFHRMSKKLALGDAGFHSKENLTVQRQSPQDLEMIHRKGAYYIFTEECDEVDRFCEEDIETILEHHSRSAEQDVVRGSRSRCAELAFSGNGGP
jgi:hypothetical protein